MIGVARPTSASRASDRAASGGRETGSHIAGVVIRAAKMKQRRLARGSGNPEGRIAGKNPPRQQRHRAKTGLPGGQRVGCRAERPCENQRGGRTDRGLIEDVGKAQSPRLLEDVVGVEGPGRLRPQRSRRRGWQEHPLTAFPDLALSTALMAREKPDAANGNIIAGFANEPR